MGIQYQADRAWANTSKGIRECQKADEALEKDHTDRAAHHFSTALYHFGLAAEHLEKAESDVYVRAGKLIDEGNRYLETSVDDYVKGRDGAADNYDKALDKYDQALATMA